MLHTDKHGEDTLAQIELQTHISYALTPPAHINIYEHHLLCAHITQQLPVSH